MELSVIIPVYNGEKYIAETISHIQESTYQNFEIIVVNDGSSDSSEAILLELAQQDDRIMYYAKKNGGVVSSRNYGLDRAHGQFVCFVDQDDIVMPRMFEALISAICETGADFAQGGKAALTDGRGIAYNSDRLRMILEKGTREYRMTLGGLVSRGGYYYQNSVNCSLWNKIFRKSFLEDNSIRFWKWCDYEDDWLFVIECLRKSNKVVVIKETVYVWRVNMLSESRNRVQKDVYIDDLYNKHCKLSRYLLEVFRETESEEKDLFRLETKLSKQSILWACSNETGRGIQGRSVKESTKVMKAVMRQERREGKITWKMIMTPLPITIGGSAGIRRIYYVFRERLVMSLLVLRMERAAVILNKHILHGRWHI